MKIFFWQYRKFLIIITKYKIKRRLLSPQILLIGKQMLGLVVYFDNALFSSYNCVSHCAQSLCCTKTRVLDLGLQSVLDRSTYFDRFFLF
jgi:hypothetical protein